jgi:hypothetical protein
MDISLSHDAVDFARGRDPFSVSGKGAHLAMTFMRESELASRRTTILAAFEAAGGQTNFLRGMESAEAAAVETLFDYSTSAKGILLKGNAMRVLMQFQTFRINAAFRIGVLFKHAIQHESPTVKRAAQKEFLGIMAMSGALSGVMGMPFVPVLLKALSEALSDDDDPVFAEAELAKIAQELLGQKLGRVAMEGPGTLFGMSVSSRIGLGDVYGSAVEPWPTTHGRSLAAYMATQMMGPSYSVFEGMFKAHDEITNKGEYMKGLEYATPKPIRDLLKAYGLASDGVKDPTGRRLLDAEDVSANEVFMMAMGFQPTDVFELRKHERNIAQLSDLLSERRGRLIRRFVKELADGDTSNSVAAITTFNQKNPGLAVGAQDLRCAVRGHYKNEAGYETPRRQVIREMAEE